MGFIRQLREPVPIVDRLSTLSVHGLRMGRLLQDMVADRRTDLGKFIQQLPVLFVMPRGLRVVYGDAWHINIERPFLLQFPFERQEFVNEVMTVPVLVVHWDHLRLRRDGGVYCFPRDLIVFRGKQTCDLASQDVYTRLRTACVESSDDMWFVVDDVQLTREAFDDRKAQRVEARMPGNPSPGQACLQCSPVDVFRSRKKYSTIFIPPSRSMSNLRGHDQASHHQPVRGWSFHQCIQRRAYTHIRMGTCTDGKNQTT